jgi:Putative peptidoglycan binding domain
MSLFILSIKYWCGFFSLRKTHFTLFLILCFFAPPALAKTTIRLGDTGQEVYELQNSLVEHYQYTGTVDGFYGEDTYYKVREVQVLHNIPDDGVVGPETWSIIQPVVPPMPLLSPLADASTAIGSVVLGVSVITATVVASDKIEKNNSYFYQGFFDDGTSVNIKIYDINTGKLVSEHNIPVSTEFPTKSLPEGRYKLVVTGLKNGREIIETRVFKI